MCTLPVTSRRARRWRSWPRRAVPSRRLRSMLPSYRTRESFRSCLPAERERLEFVLSHNEQHDVVIRFIRAFDGLNEIDRRDDLVAVRLHDDVATTESRTSRRGSFENVRHEHALRLHIQEVAEIAVQCCEFCARKWIHGTTVTERWRQDGQCPGVLHLLSNAHDAVHARHRWGGKPAAHRPALSLPIW